MSETMFEAEYAALEAERRELCEKHTNWFVAYKGTTRIALERDFGSAFAKALQIVGPVPVLVEEVLPTRPVYAFTSLRIA